MSSYDWAGTPIPLRSSLTVSCLTCCSLASLRKRYMSSNILFVDIWSDLKGSFRWMILLHWPSRNFLNVRICLLWNSIFLNTTVEGAYARHATLNYLMMSDCMAVHERHTGSSPRTGFFLEPVSFNNLDLGDSSKPSSLNSPAVTVLNALVWVGPKGSGKSVLIMN